MLDEQTVIRVPHDENDPRVSVTMQEEGAALMLFFDSEDAFAGTAPLLEIRLSPPESGRFEPWHLMPQLPIHTQYARASLAGKVGNVVAALRALGEVNTPRRGLSDEFLRVTAQVYAALIAEGEPYPVKTLAAMQSVDASTASRWISAARARGFVSERRS